MHPTGSGTRSRFITQWESPNAEVRHRTSRRRRTHSLCGLLTILALAWHQTGFAQGPIQQSSFGYPAGGTYGSPTPVYAPGYGPFAPGCESGQTVCPETIYELLPDDRYPQHDEEFIAAFTDAFQHAYFRVEYLNWDIEGPGQGFIGAPRASGGERELFNAFDPNSQAFLGSARNSTYDTVGLQNNNGIRGTFGLPTRIGLFEAGVSVLEQSGVHLQDVPFFDFETFTPVTPAITLLNNGNPNDNTMILFNQGLNVQIRTEFFTTEANFIMHPLTPNQPIEIRPLIGFQYVRFWDTLDLFGADVDVNDPNIVLNHRIRSEAKNDVFAPQIGFRAEFVHEYFSLGVTPKFMLGFNRHRDEVFTEQIFSVNEGRITTREESTEFSPGLDLSVYGRVHLGKHFSMFVSYQLYYLNNISRSTDNVFYDSSAGPTPNIVLNPQQQTTIVEGVTVGGEFRFH